MKTYVITVSTIMPATHKKAGYPTHFPLLILEKEKIHTIRSNYLLWEKRFQKIEKGEACLSVRVWEGLPYRSKQIEIVRLYKEDGIGLERLDNPNNYVFASIGEEKIHWELIAKNDGLSHEDFCAWFKERQTESMAVIHFTNFRYS